MTIIKIGIFSYPGAIKSAVFGLEEIFLLSNDILINQKIKTTFETEIISSSNFSKKKNFHYNAIVIPPAIESNFYLSPTKNTSQWLAQQYSKGSMLCSACAGAFILASTDLLKEREITTHWALEEQFKKLYPEINVNTARLLINDNDIITAGGMMAWMDLGLEIVSVYTNPNIIRQLGKILVFDTGQREQKYYAQFIPNFTHGDNAILSIQKFLQTGYKQQLKISDLAKKTFLAERIFLRRFTRATGFRPIEYIQKLRVQKACELLENTNLSFETISFEVGYQDVSTFRKLFIKIIGLTPKEFRNRFVRSDV